ncbi:MAG TPA: histidine kinase dimerization/phospho-acceptor domain-containing protein, partial [Tepidisphaeraceae bacterium]|nr:histidine kinase dimerization/phospho-acceptor domain-containing protein [Tepidisphaeraceae bacterium]
MTIKSKLLAGFGASAVLVAGVVMLSMRDLNRITRAMQDTSDSSLPEIRETHRAMEGASALLVQTEAVDNDPADFNAEAIHQSDIAAKSAFNEIQSAIEGLRAESENQLSILTNSDDIAEEHEHLDKVNELAANAETGQQEWTKLQSLLQSRSTGAIHDQISHTEAAVQKVISQALSLQAESEDEINEVIASITKDALFAGKVSVIAGSIAFLSAILIATLVSRPIVQRLARVRERAEEIGRGDLSARLDVHGNDEIGQLSKSFNHMTHMLAKTRDELLRAATAAEAASTAKSSFLANMSHEIRTPMTAVVGFAEMLLEPEQSQSDRVDALQTIRRNSRHLLELINDVLDISKIEAGKMTVERIDCDLLRLLVEVVSMTRPRAVEKGLSLHLTFDGEIPKTIRSDALRLRQILVNLIGNAIKFTSSGNIKLHVGTERIE